MANEFLDKAGLQQVWNRILDLFSPKNHSHKIEDTTDLQSTLDGKAALSHTHDEYVTKEEGKELFTDEERDKLSNIENNAQVNKIESISLNGVPQSINNKNVNLDIDLSPYAEKSALEETNENLSNLEEEVTDWYSKGFDYTKLTDEEKAQIKQDVTTVNAQFSKVYNVSGEQSVFPIDIERYAHRLDILEVYINGMRLVEGVDYSNDGQRITLTKPLNVIGQLEIVVFKSVAVNVADLASFKGDKGDKGDKGETGSKGDKGDKGEQGEQGIQGVQGIQGIQGEKGDKGDTGSKGDTGEKGEQGIQGIQGEKGETGTGISSITVTESTADSGNNVVKVSLSDGTSKSFNVKNGSKGSTGDKGEKGDKGDQGIQGEKGEKGDKLTVEELTDDDKQELREGLAAYQKKLSYTVSLASGSKTFTIPDSDFRTGVDILNIHLDGIYLHEGTDYSVSGTTVTLTNSIVNPATAEIAIIRSMITGVNDYSLLKGDKGDQGIQGIQGIQGEKGDKGDKGDTGEPLHTVNYGLGGNSSTVYISAFVGKIVNTQGFSVIVQSRGGETIWVNCTSNDGSFKGYAIRMSNTYGKTAKIWYDLTTGYLYTQQNAWSNLVSFTVIATTFSVKQPTVAQVSSIPSTATEIAIKDIALKADLEDLANGKLSTNWTATQDSSGNLNFTYG